MQNFMKTFGLTLAIALVAFGCQLKKADQSKTPEAKPVAAKAAKSPIPVGDSYTKGPADALVTIIEFSEFQCPFCARVLPTLDKVQKEYGDKVRIVFKHNPLSFHKDAPLAAQAALAAGKQGKFWDMHDVLFQNMKKLKPADLDGYAKGIKGLNFDQFKKDLNSAAIKKAVKDDQALARKVGARGTPNFFVNGEQLSGAQPFAKFKATIDKQLKAAEAAIKAGTAKKDIYGTLSAKNYKEPAKRAGKKGRRGPDSKTVYKIPAGNSYSKGPADALVTIIEFSEFQCPFCSRVLPTLDKVQKEYGDKVRIVFKHNPLPFHKDAPLASQAAIAAGKQGKFWQMHDVLFKNMKKLKAADLNGYATQIGLDMTRFAADLNSAETKKMVADDQKLARQFGARGTPNFFVNGRQITGARPFPAFKTIIDEEVKKAEKLLKSGVAKKDVYAKLIAKGKLKAAPAPKRNRPAADTKTVYKLPLSNDDFGKGAKAPLVTIVEFSEFQCPFCKRVNPTIAQILKKYGQDVRIVFKHNPLPFHKDAPLAAQASIAAGKQGKFWQMHDKLFDNMKALKADNLNAYAKEIGLNMGKFASDLNSPAVKKQVANDQKIAAQFGARGTPNFFINGRKLTGAQPLASFTKIIDEELKKAKALVSKGTARANVYNELTKAGKTKAAAPARRKAPPQDTKVYNVKVNPNDGMKGNKNAKITIVEFSEFQCPFCKRVKPTIAQIQKEYGDKVRIVFKHNPLSFHKDAPLAAQAALAAGKQGKFWQMHDILFENQRKLKPDNINGYAKEIGLNMTTFAKDLNSEAIKKQVAADQAQAKELNARGTPHFFVNGRRLRGAQPFPAFKKLIDEMLKK